MANFNRRNNSGGNRSYGNKPRFANSRPDMHKATCSSCGKICEVPFRPTGSKPVFCNDCFKNNGGSESHRSENRSFDRSYSDERQMFDAVCAKCGNDCQVPFRPTTGRDILCSRCFENNDSSDSRRPERRSFDRPSFNRDDNRSRTSDTPNYKAQFEALNAKLDKILTLLTPAPVAAPVESIIDEKVIDEIVEEVQEEKAETVTKKPRKTASKKVSSPKK